jgi:hypothetical protein
MKLRSHNFCVPLLNIFVKSANHVTALKGATWKWTTTIKTIKTKNQKIRKNWNTNKVWLRYAKVLMTYWNAMSCWRAKKKLIKTHFKWWAVESAIILINYLLKGIRVLQKHDQFVSFVPEAKKWNFQFVIYQIKLLRRIWLT